MGCKILVVAEGTGPGGIAVSGGFSRSGGGWGGDTEGEAEGVVGN